jgi:hypothetical protein
MTTTSCGCADGGSRWGLGDPYWLEGQFDRLSNPPQLESSLCYHTPIFNVAFLAAAARLRSPNDSRFGPGVVGSAASVRLMMSLAFGAAVVAHGDGFPVPVSFALVALIRRSPGNMPLRPESHKDQRRENVAPCRSNVGRQAFDPAWASYCEPSATPPQASKVRYLSRS